MDIYGDLVRAQLEARSSVATPALVGRIYWRTDTLRTEIDTGAAIKQYLMNDQTMIMGTSGTASSNLRWNRAGVGKLQLVTADDTTAEASLSTAVAQLSARHENGLNSALPTAASAGRVLWATDISGLLVDTGSAWWNLTPMTTKGDVTSFSTLPVRVGIGSDGQVLTADSASTPGLKWATIPSAPDSSEFAENYTIVATVGSNILTVALKTKAGSNPSASDIVGVGLRNGTITSGSYNFRQITAALSQTLTNGSSLGHQNGVAQYIYVYLVDSDGAGTMKIGLSSVLFDEGSLQSTTAEGGSGAATSNAVMYSAGTYSLKPVRLIGRMLSSQTTAGTWASAPTEISLLPFQRPKIVAIYNTATAQVFGSAAVVNFTTKEIDNYSTVVAGAGWAFTCPRAGRYLVNFELQFAALVFAINEVNVAEIRVSTTAKKTFVYYGVTITSVRSIIAGSAFVDLSVGDTVDIKVTPGTFAGNPTLSGAAISNFVCISEI